MIGYSSRLGCQINVTKEFEGIKVKIPDDGYWLEGEQSNEYNHLEKRNT